MEKTKKDVKDKIINILDQYARSDETVSRDEILNGHFISDNFKGVFIHVEEAREARTKAREKYKRWKSMGYYGGESVYKDMQNEMQLADAIYYDQLEHLYKYLIGEEKL